jgi:hypothetical protein
MLYVIARSFSKRPTLMHIVGIHSRTLCGTDLSMWSAAYRHEPIPEVMCMRCKLINGNA